MPAAATNSDLETAVARARRLLAILRELAEMGMDLARALRREVLAGAAPVDAEIRFCRIAKAVRQLVALEARLAQALDDAASGRWAAEEAERELRAIAAQARKDAAVEVLEEAVREAGDGEAFKQLRERLNDWSCERSVERDFVDKPVAEIVLDACTALGLEPDPALLTDETLTETLADAVRAYAAAWRSAGRGATDAPPPHREADRRFHAEPRAPALAEGP